jgi:hypothetical protein
MKNPDLMVEAWSKDFPAAVEILNTILKPPNRREQPAPGDPTVNLTPSYWFDGGYAVQNTGGGTHYVFSDGTTAHQGYPWEGPPNVRIERQDGLIVTLHFESKRRDGNVLPRTS